MSLLDPKRSFYSFKKKEEGWLQYVHDASAEVEDENQNNLGMVKGKGIFNKKISLYEFEGIPILTLKKVSLFTKPSYEILDENKDVLGIIKSKSADDMYMVDNNNNTILIGEGPFTDKKYGIGDKNRKLVASFTFATAKGWKEGFFGDDRCNLQIHNLSFARLTLLGFFIAMYSRVYDVSPKGGEG